jgi:hypothetical protein
MPGTFSGNGSVTWLIEGNNVREADSMLYPPKGDTPRRVVQTGVDETDRGEYFTITIKVPRTEKDAKAFVGELNEQVRKMRAGEPFTLRLPIEDTQREGLGGVATEKQIVIDWTSSLLRTGK